jgi:hypothetical protein
MYTYPYSDVSLQIDEMTLVRLQVPNKSRRFLERRDVKTCVNLEIPAVGGRLSFLGSWRYQLGSWRYQLSYQAVGAGSQFHSVLEKQEMK